jgi:hypothetical protein
MASVVYGCCHEASTEKGDAVATTSGDLAEEAVSTQLGEDAADALAAVSGLERVTGWCGPDLLLDIAVSQAADEMGTGEHGGEQVAVGAADGVEASIVLAVDHAVAAEGIELGKGRAGRFDFGEGVEVTPVGSLADLHVPPEVVDALVHPHPAATAASTTIALETQDPEVGRVVDHGLDPQDATCRTA